MHAGDATVTLLNIQTFPCFWSFWQAQAKLKHHAVLSQNLNPDVSVMESAENRYRCDAAELLQPPKIRRILL
jgi:hypothetical protein